MSYSIFGSRLVSVFNSVGKHFSQASSKVIHTATKSWDPVLYAGFVLSFCLLQSCLKHTDLGGVFLYVVRSPHSFSSIS